MFKKNKNGIKVQKEKRENINYFRIVWLVGILSILVFILAVVIKYKVYYEYMIGDVYFYECSSKMCNTTDKEVVGDNIVYSKYHYSGKAPSVIVLEGNYVILNKSILYNYVTGFVVTDKYDKYKISGDNIIVGSENMYGIIDDNGNEIIPLTYSEITSNDGKYFTVREKGSNLYKLIDRDNNNILEECSYVFEYNDVVILVKDMILYVQDIEGNNLIGKTIGIYDEDKLVSASVDNNMIYIKVYKDDKYYSYAYNLESNEFITNA